MVHAQGQAQKKTGHRRLTTITVTRPRCPNCNGVRLRKYRSLRDQGDGSALSWMRCDECKHRFRVLFE